MMALEDRPDQGPLRQIMSAWMILTAVAAAALVATMI
jgi:hypothetical protein